MINDKDIQKQVKHLLGAFLCSLLAALAFCTFSFAEEQKTIDDVCYSYDLTGKTAELCGIDPKGSTRVDIPDTLGGKTVSISCGSELFAKCDAVTSLSFPDSLRKIPSRIFSDVLPNLTKLNLNRIRSIGSGDNEAGETIGALASLKTIKVSSKNTSFKTVKGALYDKKFNMLYACPSSIGASFTVPETVEVISQYAFMNFKGNEIRLPTTLVTIFTYSFLNCSNLNSMTIPNGVSAIYTNAFSGCTSLESIYIPPYTNICADLGVSDSGTVIRGLTGSNAELTAEANHLVFEAEDYKLYNLILKPKSSFFNLEVGKSKKAFNRPVDSNGNVILRGQGNCSAESSKASVASFKTKSSAIAAKKIGKTKITVHYEASQIYKGASCSFTVKVRPAKPVLKVQSTSGQAKLSWSRSKGAKQYQLYMKAPGSKKFKKVLTKSSKVKSVTHKGLQKGKTYCYKIRSRAKYKGSYYNSDFSRTVRIVAK